MRQKGQGLVEFALILPIAMVVILALLDIAFGLFNYTQAKHITARGARAAALSTMPDGVTSCTARVAPLMDGNNYLLSDSVWDVTNCPSDAMIGIAQGSPVTVTVTLSYSTVFLPGPWAIVASTTDYGR